MDFSQGGEEAYRRAFHRLLCGLKQEPPGPDGRFTGKLQLPRDEQTAQRPLAEKEKSFLDEVFQQLNGGVPLMILAQADTDTQILIHALRWQGERLYGSANTLHIFRPTAPARMPPLTSGVWVNNAISNRTYAKVGSGRMPGEAFEGRG